MYVLGLSGGGRWNFCARLWGLERAGGRSLANLFGIGPAATHERRTTTARRDNKNNNGNTDNDDEESSAIAIARSGVGGAGPCPNSVDIDQYME